MNIQSCCTCASLLGSPSDTTFEDKKHSPSRRAERYLECCGRAVCQDCIETNPRFKTYCPFCQISTGPSRLPPGLRDPPSYTLSPSSPPPTQSTDRPPPYSRLTPPDHSLSPSQPASRDTLHFVDPIRDVSLSSISLRYNVPLLALRQANNLFADHLLVARRTIVIPGAYYPAGVSLSPRPRESEEEVLRKAKVRRWMVACKEADYDVALIYLQQADYDLQQAIDLYRLDETWEKKHPVSTTKTMKVVSRSPTTNVDNPNPHGWWRFRP